MGLFDAFKRHSAPLPLDVPKGVPFLSSPHTPWTPEGVEERQAEVKAALQSRGKVPGQDAEVRIGPTLHVSDVRGAPVEVRMCGYLVGTVPKGWRADVRRAVKNEGANVAITTGKIIAQPRGRFTVEVWPYT
jgi:hypothetical protein